MLWKTNIIWVDVETGEIITEREAKEKYIIINKIKNATTNRTTNRGTIEQRNECKRNKQRNLFE